MSKERINLITKLLYIGGTIGVLFYGGIWFASIMILFAPYFLSDK